MALVTISGYPCSGKSRRAQELRDYLNKRLSEPSYDGPTFQLHVISDDSLSIGRNVYDGKSRWMPAITTQRGPLDGRAEKPARGAVFTALTRALGKQSIVIMDGMNYIKGYRYQMYCAAREVQVRMCTVRLFPIETRSWAVFLPRLFD